MRCQSCDYRLWNLRSRLCPECGTSFVPSQFDFVPNSVRFCCPHCGQVYFGTTPEGHLAPETFDCVSCGQRIHMDEMVLLPAEGVDEDTTVADRMPWLERRKIGSLRAWAATIGQALVSPGQLMRAVPLDSPGLSAWWYAAVTSTPIFVVSAMSLLLIPLLAAAATTGGGMAFLVGIAGGLAVTVLVSIPLTLAFIAVWGAVAQGLLRLTGTTRARLNRTWQALCYSTGANLPTAVPFVGFVFGWIWWLVSAILMVKEAQRVEGWRAALAVLAFPALLLFAGVVLYVLLLATVFSAMSTAAAAQPLAAPLP